MPGHDASDIARLRAGRTRSISPENPDGAAGGGGRATEGTGARAARDLGVGWKVSPSIVVPVGASVDLAVIDGAGVIEHIWLTTHKDHWRTLVLRAAWDGADEPAIELPLGDAFCNGWGVFAQVGSQMIAANPNGGFNSYWPMPFRTGARLWIENTSEVDAVVYFQVNYELDAVPDDAGYLHGQWRRSNVLPAGTTHTMVEDVDGHGQYVGTYIAWGVNSNGWWGEGELKFFLDDDTDFPTICGTGTEDYFGGAWNFDVPGQGYTAFSTPYLGLPQIIRPDGLYVSQQRFGMYRWHVPDPIVFHAGLRKIELQALGWRSGWRYLPLQDDIATTSWFYLDRPTTIRPPAPTFDSMEVHLGSAPVPDIGASPPRPPR